MNVTIEYDDCMVGVNMAYGVQGVATRARAAARMHQLPWYRLL